MLELAAQNAPVLRYLRDNPAPETLAAFAQAVGRDRTNLRKTIAVLERDGLVTRQKPEASPMLTDDARRILAGLDVAEGLAAPPAGEGVLRLPITVLRLNPLNPRKLDNPTAEEIEALEGLADSIVETGFELLVPLLVSQPDASGARTLLAGERRWRAIQKLRLRGEWPEDRLVACIERSVPEADLAAQTAFVALVENGQREALDPLEEAEGYIALTAANAWSIAEACRRTGQEHRTRSIQEWIKVAREARPEGIARFRAGEITAEELRHSVRQRSVLSPKMALAVAEVADAVARHGAKGEVVIQAVAGGVFPDLVRAELITHRHLGDRQYVGLGAAAKAWLAQGPAEALAGTGRDEALFEIRAQVIGEGAARELARLDTYATQWLRQPKAEGIRPVAEPVAAVSYQEQRRLEILEGCAKLNPKQRLALVELGDKVALYPGSWPSATETGEHHPDPMRLAGVLISLGGGFSSSPAVGGGRLHETIISATAIEWLKTQGLYTPDGDREEILHRVRREAGIKPIDLVRIAPGQYATPWLNVGQDAPIPTRSLALMPEDPANPLVVDGRQFPNIVRANDARLGLAGGAPMNSGSRPAPAQDASARPKAQADGAETIDLEDSLAQQVLAQVIAEETCHAPGGWNRWTALAETLGLPFPWSFGVGDNAGSIFAANEAEVATIDVKCELPAALAEARARFLLLMIGPTDAMMATARRDATADPQPQAAEA
jgi:ParB/RepB/Spo0J family partition protein